MTKRPMVVIFAFMCLSIFIAANYDCMYLCILGFVVMVVSFVRCMYLTVKGKNIKIDLTVFFCAMAVVVGIVNYSLANDCNIKPLEILSDKEVVCDVKVLTRKDAGYSTDRYYVQVIEGETDGKRYQMDGKIRISIPLGKSDFDYGDILSVKGTLKKPSANSNKGLFNNSLYLKTQNVFYTMYVNDDDITYKDRQTDRMIDKIHLAKYRVIDKIDESVQDENSRAILKSIMFGDKSELDDAINDAIRRSGVSHILAVSGMHVSYIVMFMTYLFAFFGWKRRNILLLTLGVPSLALFAFMIATPSVIRAVIMMAIFIASEVLHEDSDSMTSLSVAGIVVLIINPFSLFDVGFELSFLASAGIILFYKNFETLFSRIIKIKCIRSIISMTMSAQLLTVPVLVCTFNTLPVMSVLTNVLVAWIAPVLFLGGFVIAIVAFFNTYIATLAGAFITVLATMFIQIAKAVAQIPYAVITVGDWSFCTILFYCCILLVVYIAFNGRNYRNLIAAEVLCGVVMVIGILSNMVFIDTAEMSYDGRDLETDESFVKTVDSDCAVITTNYNDIDDGETDLYTTKQEQTE